MHLIDITLNWDTKLFYFSEIHTMIFTFYNDYNIFIENGNSLIFFLYHKINMKKNY
jgi:hypothetical protein